MTADRAVDHPVNDAIELTSGAFWGRNPHDELRWMRENAPVYWDAGSGVWGVASHELIRSASARPEVFSSGGGIRPDSGPAPMMIDMDDPGHLQRRKLVNKGFTPRRVRDREESIREIADSLIDAVAEKGECDFVWDLAAWLPLIVIGDSLGVEPPDRPQLLEWSDDLLRALGSPDPDQAERSAAAFGGYMEYASRVIADRQEQSRDDLMSILVHAEVDGEHLEHEELVLESLLILIGGDETTRHVISGAAYQLLSRPERWEALRNDRDLLPTAIEEMLRWVTPIKNMARQATQDVEFGGQQIREGDKLLLLYPSGNRDEKVFDDAFTFDIARTPNDHIAYGFGTHFCLGANLARLELRIMFEQLLDRLPDLRLVEDAEPEYRPANFVSGYESLPVVFSPA